MIVGISGKIGSGKDTVAQMIQYFSSPAAESDLAKKDLLKSYKFFYNHLDKRAVWTTKRFADKLKDITCMLIGCTRKQLEDREFKEVPLGEEWNKYAVYWENPNSDGIPDCVFGTEGEAYEHAGYLGANKEDFKRSDVIVKIELTPRLMMQLLGTEAGRNIIHPNVWVNSLFSDYKEEHPVTPYQKWLIPDTRFPNEAQAIRDRDGILIRVNRKYFTEDGKYEVTHDSSEKPHPSETSLDDWEDWDVVISNEGTIEDLLHKVKDNVMPLL